MKTQSSKHEPTLLIDKPDVDTLKRLVSKRWPEAVINSADSATPSFITGVASLDQLFPTGGIPYGQLMEITGGVSSGKTTLLLRVLATLTARETVAYVDFSGSFFPAGAISTGVDPDRLLVVTPRNMLSGLRTAELLFRHRMADVTVFDLLGCRDPLPFTLLHRLRQQTTRAKGLVIFLTENNSDIVPTSMVALRLEIARIDHDRFVVTITKSRFCKEGMEVEVTFYGTQTYRLRPHS
jgi:hypothetical protein